MTEEEIDIKETFDKIQRYILKDECSKAVKYLYKLFMHGGFAKEMKNVSVETRKEALLLFMYKIFIHSSAKPDQEKETSNKKALGTDQEELKKLDQIKKQKLLVNYLQVLIILVSIISRFAFHKYSTILYNFSELLNVLH